MFEPEKKNLTMFYSKTSTLSENTAKHYWQVYITISLRLVHTKNNSTQRLKLKPKTLTFPLSADGRTDGRTDKIGIT